MTNVNGRTCDFPLLFACAWGAWHHDPRQSVHQRVENYPGVNQSSRRNETDNKLISSPIPAPHWSLQPDLVWFWGWDWQSVNCWTQPRSCVGVLNQLRHSPGARTDNQLVFVLNPGTAPVPVTDSGVASGLGPTICWLPVPAPALHRSLELAHLLLPTMCSI